MRRLFACFVAFLLFGGGVLLVHWPDTAPAAGGPSGTPTATPTTSASPSPTDEPTDDSCDAGRAVADFLYSEGFAKRDFVVGAEVVDWKKVPHVNDSDAFNGPIRSQAALGRFLAADTDQAAAARSLIGDEQAEFMSVQFLRPVSYGGNWYWKDGRARKGGEELVLNGDVWWFNVDSDCSVDLSGSVRAVCGNVGLDWITPAVRVD